MQITSPTFKANARAALADTELQRALKHVRSGFIDKRAQAVAALPEFEQLRDSGRDIKNHTLAHLDLYLEAYEEKVREAGGEVHWAETAADARDLILGICQRVGARTVTKGKSMVAEEIALNEHLAAHGIEPVETDLGEYIIQIRDEAPSHIIAPAVHLTKAQVEADFRRVHTSLPAGRDLSDPVSLLNEARSVLRERFFQADVGITGANFLVAETGTSIIVTNEGNGDLTQTLPRVHIVLASIEKVTPTLEDVSQILRLLARSATGQDMTVYTTFSTGPRRRQDPDGPDEFHVVILDNGRSAMLGSQFQDMLRCIRCAACMNHCPVYQEVGGHAYGWVYPGPMGAVLTPTLIATGASASSSGTCRRRPIAPGLASGPSSPNGRASTSSRPGSPCACSAISVTARAVSGGFRSPVDGRNTAICRRRRGRLSRKCGRNGSGSRWHERPRHRTRQDTPCARRNRRGTAP